MSFLTLLAELLAGIKSRDGGGGEGGVTKNHTSENPLLIVKFFEIWFE